MDTYNETLDTFLAKREYFSEKVLLAEQFKELTKACITDKITMELSDELFQILDAYRQLAYCSRAEAYRQLKLIA